MQSKEKLNDLLCVLFDVLYEQDAFLYMLERIEQSYGDFENKETKYVIAITKMYSNLLKDKVQQVAEQLDEYLS